MLGIFYSSLPSCLCRTFMCISGFCRKVSGFRFVKHFALGHILLFFTVHGFCFLREVLFFPGQWHIPAGGLCLSLGWTWEAVNFTVFSMLAFPVCAGRCMASGL